MATVALSLFGIHLLHQVDGEFECNPEIHTYHNRVLPIFPLFVVIQLASEAFEPDNSRMNFLAHSMFAQHDSELIVGQFCGDFIRGGSLEHFSSKIRSGILLHRSIDSYTDKHPVNLEARRYFKKPFRRYASILTDVVYDHYLARNWSAYSDMPLNDHIQIVHNALDDNFELLPLNLQRFARYMIDKKVLRAYVGFDAVEDALHRIAGRSERFSVLAQASAPIKALDSELSECFARFYPELIGHVNNQ